MKKYKMLYKVLSFNDKMLKMLLGILKLHTLHPAQFQAQGNELPQKESPFSYLSSFVYNYYSLSQVDPKDPLDQDSNPEVPFSGSPIHKEAYKTSEKFQAPCPLNLCMSPG